MLLSSWVTLHWGCQSKDSYYLLTTYHVMAYCTLRNKMEWNEICILKWKSVLNQIKICPSWNENWYFPKVFVKKLLRTFFSPTINHGQSHFNMVSRKSLWLVPQILELVWIFGTNPCNSFFKMLGVNCLWDKSQGPVPSCKLFRGLVAGTSPFLCADLKGLIKS